MAYEINRKLIHLSSIMYPLGYLYIEDKNVMLWFTGIILCIIILTEFLRFRFESVNKLFCKYFSFALRGYENSQITGAASFFLGVFLTILLFDFKIAITALCVLVISDTAASIIGIYFGKYKVIGNKTIEGIIAFLVVAILVSYIASTSFSLNFIILCYASVAATIAEAISRKIKIDDNFLIPVSYAACYWVFMAT